LVNGRVKYYRLTKNGDEVLLWWLSNGDTCGIGTLLSTTVHYIGTAEAVDECELLVWRRMRIRRLAATYQRLAENALNIVLHYLAAYADRLVGLSTSTAEERLVHTLFDLAHRTGRVRAKGVEVSITNQDLGRLAHVSTFTASRHLSEWERQG